MQTLCVNRNMGNALIDESKSSCKEKRAWNSEASENGRSAPFFYGALDAVPFWAEQK